MNETNAQVFRKGMKDAIPIGLGYLAVAFSLGIAARNAGMNAFQGFLMSMLNNASAGEYAGITVIADRDLDHQCPLSAHELRHGTASHTRTFLRTSSAHGI